MASWRFTVRPRAMQRTMQMPNAVALNEIPPHTAAGHRYMPYSCFSFSSAACCASMASREAGVSASAGPSGPS